MTSLLTESENFVIDSATLTVFPESLTYCKRPKLSTQDQQQLQQQPRRRQVVGRGVVVATRRYRSHSDGVWDVAATSIRVVNDQSSNMVLLGTASADRTARVWDADSGSCLLRYDGHRGSVNSIRFRRSADFLGDNSKGLVLTASGDGTAHVWKVPAESVNLRTENSTVKPPFIQPANCTNGPERQLTGHAGVVIAADWLEGGAGDIITASWDRSAIIYDCETGQGIARLEGHSDGLMHCSGHSSQALALTSSRDATFRLWDLRDVKSPAGICLGHAESVSTAIFAFGTCDIVVSGSDDSTACVWDLRNLTTPIIVVSTGSPVNRLSVSPIDQLIALPCDNSHIQLYDINGIRLGKLTKNHSRMVCATAWSEIESDSRFGTNDCKLFTCGFDQRVVGWTVSYERQPRSDAG